MTPDLDDYFMYIHVHNRSVLMYNIHIRIVMIMYALAPCETVIRPRNIINHNILFARSSRSV